jgi:hypothetical protein
MSKAVDTAATTSSAEAAAWMAELSVAVDNSSNAAAAAAAATGEANKRTSTVKRDALRNNEIAVQKAWDEAGVFEADYWQQRRGKNLFRDLPVPVQQRPPAHRPRLFAHEGCVPGPVRAPPGQARALSLCLSLHGHAHPGGAYCTLRCVAWMVVDMVDICLAVVTVVLLLLLSFCSVLLRASKSNRSINVYFVVGISFVVSERKQYLINSLCHFSDGRISYSFIFRASQGGQQIEN